MNRANGPENVPGLRAFSISGSQIQALPTETSLLSLHCALPAQGFVWLAFSRSHFEAQLPSVQTCLQQLTGHSLVDLHVSDLLNSQLPSRYDYTSHYDLLVFRRLAPQLASSKQAHTVRASSPRPKRPGPPHTATHRHQPSGLCGV